MTENATAEQARRLTVVVHDEDAGGEPFTFHEGPGLRSRPSSPSCTASSGTEREQDDRRICLGNGDSVFAHEQEHLEQYATQLTRFGVGLVAQNGRRMTEPAKVDPEVAALAFTAHLDDFFTNGRGRLPGWERIDLDRLRCVVRIPATRAIGTVDDYFVLGGEHYPVWPPTVAFVCRDGETWVPATPGSRRWPRRATRPASPSVCTRTTSTPMGRCVSWPASRTRSSTT